MPLCVKLPAVTDTSSVTASAALSPVSIVISDGSPTSLIVITSFAGLDTKPSLSVTVNGIVTSPLKFAVGVNTSVAAWAAVMGVPATTGVVPSARYNTPCAGVGKVVTVTKSTVPSTSIPVKSTGISLFSLPNEVDGVAVGGSFTSPTLTVTVAVSVSPSSLVIVYVKVSGPLKFAGGV